MKTRYGVTRYCMINAGTHQMSIFPVDEALSICGSNNLGKTQALHSMQFLFFNKLNEMNFGSFDLKASRNFFFPNENSFLLMEMKLPAGTFILGAYGKGPAYGNEYQLFAAKHHIDTADFVEDERICTHKRVFARWAELGIHFIELTREQMRQLIYGEYTKVNNGRWDMTLVPLVNAGEKRYSIFSHIYRNLLTQPELKSNQLKELLLYVFGDKLNNTSVNFAEVREHAFREYNLLDEQIKRTEARREDILSFHHETANFIEYRNQAAYAKRLLSVNLAHAIRELPPEIEKAADSINTLVNQRNELNSQHTRQTEELGAVSAFVKSFDDSEKELKQLEVNNSLIGKEEVTRSIEGLAEEIIRIEQNLKGAQTANRETVVRQKNEKERRITALEHEIQNYHSGKTVLDELNLDDGLISASTRVLNPELLLLPSTALKEAQKGSFACFIEQHACKGSKILEGEGFTLDIAGVGEREFACKNIEILNEDLALAKEELATILELLVAIDEADAMKQKCQSLRQDKEKLQKALNDYVRADDLREKIERQRPDYEEKVIALKELKLELSEFSSKVERLNDKLRAERENHEKMSNKLKDLQKIQNNAIFKNDDIPMCMDGDDEDYLEPLNEFDVLAVVEQISKSFNAMNNIALKNKATRERILSDLPDLSNAIDDEDLARRAMERVEQIPNLREVLKQRHNKAIIDVAAVLANLTQDYETIESQVNQFNRAINTRKISNLQRFDVMLRKNDLLMDSIQTMVDYMRHNQADGDLFRNPSQAITDPEAVRAFERLTKVMDTGPSGTIDLPDLFELSFRSIDVQGKEAIVEKLDQLGSTGTKMTMKPLLYMCLIRYLTDKKAPAEPFLPFFIDEVAGVDPTNQRSIIEYCKAMGFVPIFSSVQPTTTARYGINVGECLTEHSRIYITPDDWQYYEPIVEAAAEEQLDMLA